MSEIQSEYMNLEDWEKISVNAGYSMNHDFTKGPLKITPSFQHAGNDYLVTGALYGSVGDSYKSAYEIVPKSQFDGETFDCPAHIEIGTYGSSITLPNGTVRHRGDDTGLIVMVGGSPCVLAEKVEFKPLLPEGARFVTMDEAQAFEAAARESGWRKMLETGPALWMEYEGVVVAQYDHFESTLCMGYAKSRDGSIYEFRVDDLEEIETLRALEKTLGLNEKPTPSYQMVMF